MNQIVDELVSAAMRQAEDRFGTTGPAGAAAVRLGSDEIITSVYFEAPNESAQLCHETGAICEANRRNERIIECVCVSRDDSDGPFLVLAPCGVCIERLAYWGPSVAVAVPDYAKPGGWNTVTLATIAPWYWGKQFAEIRNKYGWNAGRD